METPGEPGYVTGVGSPATTAAGNRRRCLSGCSDVPLSKKCSRFLSGFSQKSRRFLYYSNTGVLPTSFLILPQRPVKGDHARPAAQRLLGASSPERRSSVPRAPHVIDRPSVGLAPRNGRPAAWSERSEDSSRAARCGLHSTLVRTTQEPLYLPATPTAGRRPEARAAAPRGAPSHPADDRGGPP